MGPNKSARQNRSNSRNSKRNAGKVKDSVPTSTTPPPSSAARRSGRNTTTTTTTNSSSSSINSSSTTVATSGTVGSAPAALPAAPTSGIVSNESNGTVKATVRRKTRSSAALATPESDSEVTLSTGQGSPTRDPCTTPLTSSNKRRTVSRDSR